MRATPVTAARTSGCSGLGVKVKAASSDRAMRSRPGSRPAASRAAMAGGRCRSPSWLPLATSSSSAASSTVRASGPMPVIPWKASGSGQVEIRPRWGLMPTRWDQAAGIRTEPAPSVPSAAGTSPAATAAAEPPEEPPGVWREVPGVAGVAEGRALGERPLAQFAGVGLADDDRPGRAQPPDDLGIALLGQELAGTAERGGLARHIGVVLDRDRHSEQRQPLPGRQPAVGLRRLRHGRLGPYPPEGVDAVLGGLDALQRPPYQRGRGHLALGERPCLLGEAFQLPRRGTDVPGRGRPGSAVLALVNAHAACPPWNRSFERTVPGG